MLRTALLASPCDCSTPSTILVTMSLNEAPPVAAVLAMLVAAPAMPLPAPTPPSGMISFDIYLSPEFECFRDHVANHADGGDVGLIRAGGAEHVHHLLRRVDVRQRDEAIGIGIRMRRLVAAAERGLVLHDAGHL